MKVFLSSQQKLDILHEAYCAPGVIRSKACKYNVDLVQIQQWKKNLAGMDGDAESSEVLYISSKGKAKKTLHKGKSHFNVEHYRAVFLMFDTLRTPGHIVSVMMLTVELKRISGTPVSLHVLSKCVSHWLVSVGVIQHHVTHVAQNTWHCEIAMQDFTNYINSQLVLGQYRKDCVVNIDETNIFFDMEGGLTLAEKGDKTVSPKTKGTSMRCTVLLGVTMNGEKLTPLVAFQGKLDGRIARNFGGMPSSMRYICQDKAWVDHRVFKSWINQVWAPFALEKGDKTYLLMDEFSVHLIASCSNQIKGCETTIDYILGGYTSKLQVMDVGVNKPFKGYVRQAYENFMIGNIEIER